MKPFNPSRKTRARLFPSNRKTDELLARVMQKQVRERGLRIKKSGGVEFTRDPDELLAEAQALLRSNGGKSRKNALARAKSKGIALAAIERKISSRKGMG